MEKLDRTEINELGEFGLIKHLTGHFSLQNNSSVLGVGDDAAVINHNGKFTAISTDVLLEGVHFDLMYTPLPHLGYKAISVNVSDICAMNAVPEQVLVSIGISNRFSVEALESFYQGIKQACEDYGVDLVGGDTSTSLKGFFISVTSIGSVEPDKYVKRSTAKQGDLIYVSGDLGAAFTGLQLLEREKQVFLENPDIQPDLEDQTYTVGRQLKPKARLDIVKKLSELKIIPTSMIDISDGLSSEILHICSASETGCLLEESLIPIDPDTYNLALKFNLDPIVCALNGGDDYELLFTISPEHEHLITTDLDMTRIGIITEKTQEYFLKSKAGKIHPLIAQGWAHLNK